MVAKFWLKVVSVGNDTLEYVGELSKQSLVPEERMLVRFVSEHLSETLILVILFLDIIIITCMQP